MSARLGIGVTVAVVAMTGAMSTAGADVIVFQEGVGGYTGTRDNTIYEDTGRTAFSNGSGDFVFAGNNRLGFARRGLIAFDVSAIPAGSTIVSVSLTLTVSRTRAGDSDQSLHRLNRDWGEGGEDAPSAEGMGTAGQQGTATWGQNHLSQSDWNEPGGEPDSDYATVASATATVGGIGSHPVWSSDAMAEDVQAWLDDPSTNFGWILIGDESGLFKAKRYVSADNNDDDLPRGSVQAPVADRPELEVEFAPPLAGDCDGDGDVDLGDFLVLLACFGGPGVDAGEACDCADLDGDLDVDLADLLEFQAGFTDSR